MEEVRVLRAQYDSSVAEARKVRQTDLETPGSVTLLSCLLTLTLSLCAFCVAQLREELLRARQTHGGELDGMRKEVSRLTTELHHRDLTIASMEAERVEQNTSEPKVSKASRHPGCGQTEAWF